MILDYHTVFNLMYPVGSGGSFPGGKEAGSWSWPHTSI